MQTVENVILVKLQHTWLSLLQTRKTTSLIC